MKVIYGRNTSVPTDFINYWKQLKYKSDVKYNSKKYKLFPYERLLGFKKAVKSRCVFETQAAFYGFFQFKSNTISESILYLKFNEIKIIIN